MVDPLIKELTNEFTKLIDEWLVDRDNDRRSFGSAGTVAYRISERVVGRLRRGRREDLSLGAKTALHVLGENADLSESDFEQKLSSAILEILK